jgi:hypothetical protein
MGHRFSGFPVLDLDFPRINKTCAELKLAHRNLRLPASSSPLMASKVSGAQAQAHQQKNEFG